MPSTCPKPLSAAAVLAAILLVSCGQQTPTASPENVAAEVPAEPPRQTLPVVEAPLDRESLLFAVARAASAQAAGVDHSETQRKLDGRRFELPIRFGCKVAQKAGPGAAYGVSFDSEERTLRLRIAPDIKADDPLIAAVAGDAVEAVEGFWLARPWMLRASCPLPSAQPSPEQPAGGRVSAPRVGIAQFFTSADPRTHRRDTRAYEATKILAEGEEPSAQGYDLVISGRLRKLADGRAIACTIVGADRPPACVVSAEIDRVWLERPDNRKMIAEWRRG